MQCVFLATVVDITFQNVVKFNEIIMNEGRVLGFKVLVNSM